VSTDPAAVRPGRAPSASACEPYHELITEALARGRNAMAIWQDLVDRYRFTLRGGVRERSLYDQVRAGQIRGCSIAFQKGVCAYVGPVLEYRTARLTEISICPSDRSPAWWGTWCRAE
jgi:hypothetical protein